MPTISKKPTRESAIGVPSRVAIYGGDGRHLHRFTAVGSFRVFSGNRYGRGSLSALDEAIRTGSIDLVIVLVRFIGHPEYRALKRVCRSTGTMVRCFRGSSLRRIFAELPR